MGLLIGSTAPDFEQDSTKGKIEFHEWIGDSWAILFSHPADFTPVCTTELGRAANLADEFEKRGVKMIAISVDPVESHNEWIPDIEETQNAKVGYPIIADADHEVSKLYEMFPEGAANSQTVRSVFVIDPKKKIRAMITYPASTGRNFQEILRLIDSLQLTDSHSVATPVDWQQGDDCVILPAITDKAELERKFPKGYEELRPYLRMTPQPNR